MEGDAPKGFWKHFTPAAVGFKWGGGVVSNTTFATVSGFLAILVVGWALSGRPVVALGACALIAFLLAFYLLGTWIFSAKYQTLAALGGPEYVRVREAEMGTKGRPHIPASPSVEPPILVEHKADQDGT